MVLIVTSTVFPLVKTLGISIIETRLFPPDETQLIFLFRVKLFFRGFSSLI